MADVREVGVERQRHVVAIGGGSFVGEPRVGTRISPLVRYALDLTGAERPKVCFVTTAVGDTPQYTAMLYGAFVAAGTVPTSLALFQMPSVPDIRAHLLDQDLVYVTGGNTANLLALWRVHAVDDALRAAWEAGVVLTGQSAGSLCWHTGGTTDSFGPDLVGLPDGLGLLPYSHCPHYDGEEQRRPLYHRLVGEGALDPGYAVDEGAALHYEGVKPARSVAVRDGATSYFVAPDGSGGVVEEAMEARRL
jgi:peptidase E